MTTVKTKITGTKSTNKVKALPRGVEFRKNRNKYQASVVFTTPKGTFRKYVGCNFSTPQEASKARKEYILSLV